MLNRIRAYFLWSDMFRKYVAGDYAAAAVIADKYRTLYFNNAAFRALDATIDIGIGKSESAKEKFTELASYLNGIKGDDARYIKYYSEYYVCLIDRAKSCDAIRQDALSVPASKHIKNWLQLPDEAVL